VAPSARHRMHDPRRGRLQMIMFIVAGATKNKSRHARANEAPIVAGDYAKAEPQATQ
jgi:hypothetical protein